MTCDTLPSKWLIIVFQRGPRDPPYNSSSSSLVSVVADVAVAAVGTGVAQLATALLRNLQSYVRGREGWVQMKSTCLTTSLPRPHCSTLVVCWPKLATTT